MANFLSRCLFVYRYNIVIFGSVDGYSRKVDKMFLLPDMFLVGWLQFLTLLFLDPVPEC